jgi:predicted neuraminidase
MRAESIPDLVGDQAETWSKVQDTDIPNPGSGLEVIRLRNGNYLMVCNDTESGRHRLAVLLSEDEGKTWRCKRYLENDPEGESAGSYSYPSVIESRDGTIHVSYSYHVGKRGEAIKWAHFNEAWVRQQ